MDPLLLFRIEPGSGVPIYRQLMDQVVALAAGGRLKAGDLIPSVRVMAERLRVNPMTVSRAWAQLERDGVLEHVRGTGMRLCTRPPVDLDAVKPLAAQLAAAAIHRGLSKADIHRLIDDEIARLEDHHG